MIILKGNQQYNQEFSRKLWPSSSSCHKVRLGYYYAFSARLELQVFGYMYIYGEED